MSEEIRAYFRGQEAARNSNPVAPVRDERLADPKLTPQLRARLESEHSANHDAYVTALLLKKQLSPEEQAVIQRGVQDCLKEMRR